MVGEGEAGYGKWRGSSRDGIEGSSGRGMHPGGRSVEEGNILARGGRGREGQRPW